MTLWTSQPRVIMADVIVTFEPCPPGYIFNHTSSECVFGKYPFVQTNGQFASKIQRGCWMGYYGTTNDTLQLVTGECVYYASAIDLFQDVDYFSLPKNYTQIDEKICKPLNRTGVLCGRCVDGFAPAVNSKHFQCVNCTSGIQYYSWVLYILTEYVPITILLIIVILFNISVTSGPGNAFVFFAQIISSTFSVESDGTVNYQLVTRAAGTIQLVYTSLYDIWNLNFFDSIPGWQYCLSPNLNSLQIRGLEYLTAVYPLILLGIILLIIVLYERQIKIVVWMLKPLLYLARFRRRWSFKRSIIDAFATFLVLSFTKFAIISAFITYPTPLYDENGTVAFLTCYVFGEYAYFSKEYAPYLAISIVTFIIVCLLMPLILLLYSLKPVYRCLTKLKLTFLLPGPKFQIFLNVFYNCYKDGTDGNHDLRFFASVYFGIRVLLVFFYPISPTWESQYILQQIVCTVGVLLFATLQPYKNRFYNCLDASVFSLLAVINVISFYNRHLAAVGSTPSKPAYWLQIILIFLPVIFMSCYLVFYFSKANKRLLKLLFWRVCCCRKRHKAFLLSSGRHEQSFGSFMDSMVAAGEWRDTIHYHGPVVAEPDEQATCTPRAPAIVFHSSVNLLELHNDKEEQNYAEPLSPQSLDLTTHSYGSTPSSQRKSVAACNDDVDI